MTLLQRCIDMGLDAEILEAVRDSARMDWIIDNCTSRGGGNGFTLFVPIDSECIRGAIDAAMQQEQQ